MSDWLDDKLKLSNQSDVDNYKLVQSFCMEVIFNLCTH